MVKFDPKFPNYDDDSDYNTNANSYYKDLGRKTKLIKLLAKRIWEYENTLNETLEEIEKRLTDYILQNDLLMNERLENWEKRIDEMPEEMRTLFIEWLNDGTLEQIINDDVLGNKADKIYVDELNKEVTTKMTHLDGNSSLNYTGNVRNKIIVKTAGNTYNIFTNKPTKDNYVNIVLDRPSGSPSDTSNYGENWDLVRLTGAHGGADGLVYNQPETLITTGFTTTTFKETYYTQPKQKNFLTNLDSGGASEISFEVNITGEHNGVLNIGFYGSPNTDKEVSVKINGDERGVIDTSLSSNGIKVVSVDVSGFLNVNTVTLTPSININDLSNVVHFLGYNVYPLKDAPLNLEYTGGYTRVSGPGTHYISQSKGANEYALQELDGKWFGSYHGGEVNQELKVMIDGTDISTEPTDSTFVGKEIQIIQKTRLIDKVTANSLTTIYNDGTYEFQTYLETDEAIDLTNFYTTMTCSNTDFTDVIYPLQEKADSGDTRLPNEGKVIQFNPQNSFKLTTLYTKHVDYDGTYETYIRNRENTYNKFYHGKVNTGNQPLKNLGFSNVKIFD